MNDLSKCWTKETKRERVKGMMRDTKREKEVEVKEEGLVEKGKKMKRKEGGEFRKERGIGRLRKERNL